MTTMASQITSLTTQPFIQTQIKGNIKAPRHWPLCWEFNVTGEFLAQKASYAENVSIDDVIMSQHVPFNPPSRANYGRSTVNIVEKTSVKYIDLHSGHPCYHAL